VKKHKAGKCLGLLEGPTAARALIVRAGITT